MAEQSLERLEQEFHQIVSGIHPADVVTKGNAQKKWNSIAKPSDLIPELQGRLPIRVELQALTTSDFERILTEPNASITVQYKALMATEGVNIEFTDSGIKRIAEAAWQVNESTENIGARRLHTVLERLMEEISYDASDLSGQNITIDADYVSKHLDALVADEDLSRFIL